ncbi:MAG: methyltransferase domain-containing protein [Proteobacteria bacterium]|nr:methyltransferase domain-containing protein [Pseudomonadota bacterium]
MPHSNASAAQLLVENFSLLENLSIEYGVLDLACGEGRNGLHLAEHKLKVTFADYDETNLSHVENELHAKGLQGQCWRVDLEVANSEPLADKCFDAVLVFNYLHRPLMPAIKQVIRPGGVLFYDTFTMDQIQFGKPTNPDYLLRPGELLDCFKGWERLYYFEGEMLSPGAQNRCAKASLIARKP